MAKTYSVTPRQRDWRKHRPKPESQGRGPAWECDIGTWEKGRTILVHAPDRTQAIYSASQRCTASEEVVDIRGPLTRDELKRWQSKYE